MEPLDITNIRDEHEKNMRDDDDLHDSVVRKEIMEIVDARLDMSLRSDYLRILYDVYVPKPRREQIYAAIVEILNENRLREGL